MSRVRTHFLFAFRTVFIALLLHVSDGEGEESCASSSRSADAIRGDLQAHGAELRLRGGARKLAPAFDAFDPPPTIAASKDLKMSELDTPHILTGLLKDDWKLGSDFFQNDTGKVLRVDVNPIEDGDEAPRKLVHNSTLISPATMAVPMHEALDLLRRGPEGRGFQAYVRHLSLQGYPEVASQLPLGRALHLAGPVLKSANLWLGDGGMRSSVHWDGHDNILLQLAGSKTVLLLPPEATPFLGYREWSEHRYVLHHSEPGRAAFAGHRPELSVVSNHAKFDAFDPELSSLDPSWPLDRARVAVLQPGQALFLPALWSHAVVSAPAARAEGAAAEGLNVAFNLWFVHACASHRAALAAQPAWAEGYFSLGNDLGSAGRHAEAAAAFAAALRVRPAYFDAAHNLASMAEAQGDYAAAEAQYLAARQLRPRDVTCLHNLGIVRRRQGRLAEAEAAYREAIALSGGPGSGDERGGGGALLAKGYSLLGNALALQERLEEAEGALRRATELQPADAKAWNSRGVVLAQRGRAEEARGAFERVLALAPDDAKARQNLQDLVSGGD